MVFQIGIFDKKLNLFFFGKAKRPEPGWPFESFRSSGTSCNILIPSSPEIEISLLGFLLPQHFSMSSNRYFKT
jgi:hypothetical protein